MFLIISNLHTSLKEIDQFIYCDIVCIAEHYVLTSYKERLKYKTVIK